VTPSTIFCACKAGTESCITYRLAQHMVPADSEWSSDVLQLKPQTDGSPNLYRTQGSIGTTEQMDSWRR
jgi:hypothetical protein